MRSMMKDLVKNSRIFVENEGRSCSMDIGGITPEYVQRMWGGSVSIKEIENAMRDKDKAMKYLKAIWLFCSYLFVPQWGRHKEA